MHRIDKRNIVKMEKNFRNTEFDYSQKLVRCEKNWFNFQIFDQFFHMIFGSVNAPIWTKISTDSSPLAKGVGLNFSKFGSLADPKVVWKNWSNIWKFDQFFLH